MQRTRHVGEVRVKVKPPELWGSDSHITIVQHKILSASQRVIGVSEFLIHRVKVERQSR